MARSKTYHAARDFSYGGVCFVAGDEVTGRALRAALRLGDEFVTHSTPKTTDTSTSHGGK